MLRQVVSNMKRFIIITFSIILFCLSQVNYVYSDSHVTVCTLSSGVFDKTQPIDNGYCASAPDAYEVVAYELYLCTSEPTAPTTSSIMDLSSCFKNWESASGATLSVQQNVAIDVPGTLTRPPNGIYTHGVMLMDNTFGITMSLQFDESVTAQDGTSGVFCATVAGASTYGTGSLPTSTSTCGASAITAGKYVETLNTFDSSDFTASAEGTNLNGTTASMKGYLIDTNRYLAVNDADVARLMGSATFAAPVVFTDDTTTLTMSFNVGEGMSLFNSSDGNNHLVFGSGPFQAVLAVD